MTDDLENARFPWLRTGFDIEGILAALVAWLVGILLGLLWGPLFWIGAAAAIACLLATRYARRSPPVAKSAILAPCDGVVISVERDTPPGELRLPSGSRTRVRVSASPAATNRLYAPVGGDVSTMIKEIGEPGMALAWKAEAPGLSTMFVTIDAGSDGYGMRFASGGLGPRLDIDVDVGDTVKAGRRIGKRRLGGWCDFYLPGSCDVVVTPGQSLLGGETLLAVAAQTVNEDLFDASESEPISEEDAEAAALFEKLKKAAEAQT